jgi:LPXTG-motif cell wall-anchored protein
VPGIFTLTVRNGSGSGSYVVGAQVIVIADNPSNNSEFSGWTVEPSTAVVASKSSMGTVLIMPASNVTMTANYKSKTNTGNTGTVTRPGGSTGNGTGTGNGSGSSTGSSNGTTVVINKNGLSNTGVVSVTVNGSSDNFVVKISEDANATEAALKALMNEYGDLTNISYFPMDISLYDSTGTNKITDTTGLAVDITLPIPDSLIPYAGNNKVASVVDGRLEKLTPKFTTISGVPCISFTATHFSPYVIYVDTKDLSAGTIQDSTPKTGDGIHPKWFLAMGLACISFILFIKKEKNGVPVKAAAAR